MKHRVLILIVALLYAPSVFGQLSLDQYRSMVLEYSHSLHSAIAAGEGAEADMRHAEREYYPSLSVGGSADYAFRNLGEERQWGWALRADISQPIYSGGAIRAAAHRARWNYDATRSAELSTMLSVIYDADVAYWRLSRATMYRQAIADYHDIVLSLRDIVSHRYAEGYTSKSDLLQVESRLSDAEYQLSQATQQWLVALHNFNVLRGADPAATVSLSQGIGDTIPLPSRCAVDSVVDSHPDYLAALSLSDAAYWAVKLRAADYLPSLRVGIYGVWQPGVPNISGAGTRLDGGVALSFSAPIFHFGQRREAVASARSSYRRAQYAVEDTRDEISLNESNGWTNLESTYHRVSATRRSLTVAKDNLDISTYSYNEGLVTILDVLQAQLSWLQIYQNAISAQYDYAIAIASYNFITASLVL